MSTGPRPVPANPARPRTGQWARKTVATFVYARLHNFSAICQGLAGDELTAFVNEARRALSEPALRLGGEIAQRRPDSILAVFSDKPESRKPDHAQRALHAAILAVHETVQLAGRVAADWPKGERFDAIFCRNVVIYFDRETQLRLAARFASMLSPGGLLVVGHSETFPAGNPRFTACGRTSYELHPN